MFNTMGLSSLDTLHVWMNKKVEVGILLFGTFLLFYFQEEGQCTRNGY